MLHQCVNKQKIFTITKIFYTVPLILYFDIRLLIISIYCYTTERMEGAGYVDWRGALAIFYSHVLVCFILNLILNDCDPRVGTQLETAFFSGG